MEEDAEPRWPQMAAAERAEAYSPSTMVGGDLGPFIRAYKDQSAAAYAAVGQVHTIAYGGGPSQTLDLALPVAEGPVPLHVFIHGGYWQELSKKESFFAAPASLSRGMAFAALDYTLAPQADLDQIVEECTSALRLLRAQADNWSVDADRIVVSGSSAGAHLAAMASLRLKSHERPAGLILLSGIYDLRPLVGTYINDALGMTEETASQNSPGLQDLGAFPASLVAWAAQDTDEFKRQSRAFARGLNAAGRQVDVLEVPGRNHFDVVHELSQDTPLADCLHRFAFSRNGRRPTGPPYGG